MAKQFNKQEVLGLKDFSATAAVNGQIALGDEQRGTALALADKKAYLDAYGINIPLGEITQGSITMHRSVGGQTATDKTTLGHGVTTNDAGTGFTQITAYLSKPKVIKNGFFGADNQASLPDAAAIKFAEALTDLEDYREVAGFQALALRDAVFAGNLPKGVTLPEPVILPHITQAYDTGTDEKGLTLLRNLILKAAFTLRNQYNKKAGVRRVPMENIFIELGSLAFNALADARLLQNVANEVFQGGLFTVGKLGGFTVRENVYIEPFTGKLADFKTTFKDWEALGANQYRELAAQTTVKQTVNGQDYDAGWYGLVGFIGTTYVGKSPRRIVAAKAGTLELTEDKAYYVEMKFVGDNAGDGVGIASFFPDLLVPLCWNEDKLA